MSFSERIGFKKYEAKSSTEAEIEAMEQINFELLDQFLADKTKLDLFDQVNRSWVFKSGRWIK